MFVHILQIQVQNFHHQCDELRIVLSRLQRLSLPFAFLCTVRIIHFPSVYTQIKICIRFLGKSVYISYPFLSFNFSVRLEPLLAPFFSLIFLFLLSLTLNIKINVNACVSDCVKIY